eukprot:g9911.t1
MGKLNSFIKFVVFNVNALLFLGGIGMIVVASLILTADFIKLAKTYMQTRGMVLVFIGIFVAGMSVIGCVGTHRQIQRDRLWSGRRILSLYQCILIAVVVGQGLLQMKLYSIEVSLKEAAANLSNEHGEFEGRFRDGFNEAYYEQLCSAAAGGESWVWSLAEDLCPGAISRDACSCSDILDGSGLPLQCSVAETYSGRDCCPDEDFCDDGLEQACPYAACRPGILDGLLNYITPARKYATFVFVLEGLVLALTCLLICYSPRDSTEDILIKTGTLVKHHGQLEAGGGGRDEGRPGEGSKSVDPEGEPEPGASTTAGVFQQDYLQPMAAAAKRRSRAGLREGAGGHKPRGSGTPSLSPLGARNAPDEPLRQYMTPRRAGGKIVFAPDSPLDGDDESFEYHNPRKGGKAASVGPQRSSTAAAAATTAATAAGAARGSEMPRSGRGGSKATTAGSVTAAGALAGLVSVGASPRRKGEEKTGKDGRDDDDEEEKKEVLSVRLMEYEDDGDQEEEADSPHSGFYDDLGSVQTPTAAYGAHRFRTTGEAPASPEPAAATLGAKTSSVDPDTFLTDSSSVPDTSSARGFLHAGGNGYLALPSPIPPPLSSTANTDTERQPPRFGGQTPILTSPVAATSRPRLNVAIPASNATAGAGQKEGAETSSAGVPRRPSRLMAQTPIASPTGGSPGYFVEQTAAGPTGGGSEVSSGGQEEGHERFPAGVPHRPSRLLAQTPIASPTGGSPGSFAEQTAAVPPAAAPAGGGTDVSSGVPTKDPVTPAGGANEPASGAQEDSPSSLSNVTQAPLNNLSISVDNDTGTQQPQENIGAPSGGNPGGKNPSIFFRRFRAQTPVGAQTPTGAQTPVGAQQAPVGAQTPTRAQTPVGAANVGFNTPMMTPSIEHQGEPAFGSAAYPGNRGSSFSGTIAAEALRLGPPPEESSLPPKSNEPAPTPQQKIATTRGDSLKFSVQTPVGSPRSRTAEIHDSADAQPATSPTTEAAATAPEDATRTPILPPEPPPPKAKQSLGVVEDAPKSVMAKTPVPQSNPGLYESTASADTHPISSPAQAAERGGGGDGATSEEDAAAPTEPTAPEPPTRFARFLLQAQESMSRAQMALSLEFDPPGSSPEISPAHISPLRPVSSAAETSAAVPSAAAAAAAAAVAAAEPPADESEDENGKTSEEPVAQGGSAGRGGNTGGAGGELASGEPETGHE